MYLYMIVDWDVDVENEYTVNKQAAIVIAKSKFRALQEMGFLGSVSVYKIKLANLPAKPLIVRCLNGAEFIEEKYLVLRLEEKE